MIKPTTTTTATTTTVIKTTIIPSTQSTIWSSNPRGPIPGTNPPTPHPGLHAGSESDYTPAYRYNNPFGTIGDPRRRMHCCAVLDCGAECEVRERKRVWNEVVLMLKGKWERGRGVEEEERERREEEKEMKNEEDVVRRWTAPARMETGDGDVDGDEKGSGDEGESEDEDDMEEIFVFTAGDGIV